MTLWKVTCMEHRFPGMWQRWYKHQCVAVGWPPGLGYRLNKDSTKPYEPGGEEPAVG
jgi:hypothetical protein